MNRNRNCEGMTRRDCLQLGLAGLAGGGLVNMLGLKAQAAAGAKGPLAGARAKSCIMLWLDGGPSHFETFDPKPAAPVEIRGEFDPIDTKTPGVQFSEVVPKLASISDKLCIVRSIQHRQGLLVGCPEFQASRNRSQLAIGTLYWLPMNVFFCSMTTNSVSKGEAPVGRRIYISFSAR